MDYSPLYALLTVIVFLVIFGIIFFRIFLLYKRKENMYHDLMSLQDGILFLLSFENLKCLQVYPTRNPEQYYRLLRKNVIFSDIVAEEFHQLLFSTIENIKTTGLTQEIYIRLSNFSYKEDNTWVVLALRKINWEKTGSILVAFMKNKNELMRLRNLEKKIEYQERHLQVTSFDLLWKLDVEARELTLLNDLVEKRHWVISKSAGNYLLHDLILSSDCAILEDEINFRVREFLKNGKDIYAENSRILRVRLRASGNRGIWFEICGVIDKDLDGRLVMYGSARRLPIPPLSSITKFDAENLIMGLMKSPSLRVFWCDLDGVILGCNRGFALDMGEQSPDDLKMKKIEELENLKKEWLSYFYKHLENFKEYSAIFPFSKFFHVKKDVENIDVWGQFDVLPLIEDSGKVYGGIFIYWIQSFNEVERDILTF